MIEVKFGDDERIRAEVLDAVMTKYQLAPADAPKIEAMIARFIENGLSEPDELMQRMLAPPKLSHRS